MLKNGLAHKMNIFVSYTTRDRHISTCLLQAVFDVASNFGSPYIDLMHNNSSDKQGYVEFKLSESNMVVLLLSDSIWESKWVQWELNEAKSLGIPVLEVPANFSSEETLNLLKCRLFNEQNKLRGIGRGF